MDKTGHGHAGVSQGLKLETLLFLIHINDLADDLSSSIKLWCKSFFKRIKWWPGKRLASELSCGKWVLTQTQENKHRKAFSCKIKKVLDPYLVFQQ